MIVLIPAYEPGARLEPLVEALRAADPDVYVVVVDDGSGGAFAETFARVRAAGATVLAHDRNRGKGAALKTGFAYAAETHPGDDVVTADADGQHTPHDVLRVAEGLREDAAEGRSALILGCRDFGGAVPLRSRVGNAIARGLFRLAAGWTLSDTQTGLRGIPAPILPWLRGVPGERFEYEQNVLLRSGRAGVATRELPIETVYLDANASSHFRPIVDSLRVVLPLALFAGSSLLAFAIDTVALLVLTALTGWLVPSIVAARVLSASVNFAVNRRLVFRPVHGRTAGQALRYALLASALLASNVVWLEALTGLGVPLVAAKIATEGVLFVTGYGAQRTFVFGSPGFVPDAGTGHRNRIASMTRMDADTITIGRLP